MEILENNATAKAKEYFTFYFVKPKRDLLSGCYKGLIVTMYT